MTDLVAFEDAPTHRVAPPSERRSPLVPVALALFALLGVLGVFLALAAKRTPTANATTAIGKESAPPLMPVPSEPLPPAVAAAMAEPPEPAVAPSAIATPPLATAPVPSSAIAARPAAVKPAAKVGSAKPSVPVSTQPRTYGGVPLRIDSPSR